MKGYSSCDSCQPVVSYDLRGGGGKISPLSRFLFLNVALLFVAFVTFMCSCSSVITHTATSNDITLSTEMDLSSLGIKYVVMPKCDIDDLELTTYFYDSDDKLLTVMTHTVGSVKEGVQSSFSVSIVELGFSTALKVDYSKTKVSGGIAYGVATSYSGVQQPIAVIGETKGDSSLGIILIIGCVIAAFLIVVIAFCINFKK